MAYSDAIASVQTDGQQGDVSLERALSNPQHGTKLTMNLRTLIALVPVLLLTACFSQAPTTEEVAKLVQERWNNSGRYKISKVKITDLNCAKREGKYRCEFNEEVEGTQQTFTMKNLRTYISDVPYSNKSKSSMTMSKGDKGWIKELW